MSPTATDGLDDQSNNKPDYECVAIIMIETFVSAWSAPGRPWSAMGWLLVRLAIIEAKTARVFVCADQKQQQIPRVNKTGHK